MQPIIVYTLYFLTIFIPLTFTTINFELFEFPKFILLLSGALIISAAWIIEIVQRKNWRSTLHHLRSPMSYAVLAILVTQAIATLFSVHPYTSFWGYYSRFHQGLLTTMCYSVIYFAATYWLDTKSTQKLIKVSLGTAFFVSLYAIAEHFGIDKNLWVQDVQNRVFSTLGQPNWLAAYVLPNLFLIIYLYRTNKSKQTVLYGTLFLCLFVALIFTRSRSGLIGFILSFLTYYLVLLKQFSFTKIKRSLLLFTSLLILSTLFLGSAFTPSLLTLVNRHQTVAVIPVPQGTALETGGTESGDIRKIVWTGALKLIQKHPLFGTGPETFAYTYYWERPVAHNLTTEWDFLYNKAHNEYLNIAAGSGIIGLLAYLAWHVVVATTSLTTIPRSKKVNNDQDEALREIYPVLGASIVGFAITNFFGFSVIPVYLLMTLIAVLPSTLRREPQTKQSSPFILYFIFPLLLVYPLRLFMADYNFARGKAYFDAGQTGTAVPLLEKSIKLRPSLDLFRNTLSEAYTALALSASKQSDQTSLAQAQKYATLALSQADTTRALNPLNLNDYKSRAKVYLAIAGLDAHYNEVAAAELEKSRTLAPTDPKLSYNLALVYTRLNKLDKAEEQLRESIKLRPIYPEPYYALTLLYEQTKQVDKITPLLTSAKANLATYSAQLKEKIDKYTN